LEITESPALETQGSPLPDKPLDRSMLHSIAWVAASKWGSQVLVWTSTVIVARILSPGDYGVVTVAGVYMGVLTLLTEFGINAGVVALREQTEHELAQLNTVAVLVSLAGFAVACALG
jgi:O-antigen/teichoic acid export membrane protein